MRVIAGVVCVFSLIAVRTASAGDPAVEDVVAANASAIGSIQTLYTKITLKVIPAGRDGPSLAYSAEYWKEPGLVRARQTCELGKPGQVVDYLRANGESRAVTKNPGPRPNTISASLLIAAEWRPVLVADAWKFALCGLPQFDSEAKPMPSLAEAVRQMRVREVTTVTGPQGRLTRMTLEDGDADTYTVWLDPTVNSMIRKVVRKVDAGRLPSGQRTPRQRNEYEVAEFTEVRPGIFLPTKTTLRSYLDDELSVTQEAEFSGLKVNELATPPLPKKLTALAGIAVTNELTGTTYTGDAEGNPQGPTSTLRYAPPPVVPARPDPNTTPEPGLWSYPSTWLVVLSGLFAAGAVIVRCRRRASTAAGS